MDEETTIRNLGVNGEYCFRAVPEWSADNLKKTCDRACLVNIMDGYMNAIFVHNPKAVPMLAKD